MIGIALKLDHDRIRMRIHLIGLGRPRRGGWLPEESLLFDLVLRADQHFSFRSFRDGRYRWTIAKQLSAVGLLHCDWRV